MEGRLLRKHFALNNAFIAKPELQASTKSFKIRDKVSVLVSQLTYADYYAAPGAPHDLPRPGCTDFFMCYTANEQVTAIAFMGRRCGALAMLEMEGDVPDGALMRLFRSGETAGAGAFKDIKNKTTDPCISKTVQAALDANKDVIGMIGGIISLFDASKKVTLNIYDGTTTNNKPGQYQGASFVNNVFQANITLQTSYFKNSSKETAIAVLIHEAVHAYIHTSGSKILEGDHETISKKYIDPMAGYLQNYFGISIKDSYALAWNGVQDSKAYMDAKDTDTFTMSDGNTITKNELGSIAGAYAINGEYYADEKKRGTPICN